jgi:membrane protease YdiL (CAAX protease family)
LADHLVGILFPSFFGLALAEEPGFRGFALPRLLEGRSALAASLILGVLHAIWHIPLFIFGSDSPIIIPIVISGAVINTWLFNNTNGSVLTAMLLHTSVDRMVYIFNPLFSGADAERQAVWVAVVYVAGAVILPILTGVELGRKPEAAAAGMPADRPLAIQ